MDKIPVIKQENIISLFTSMRAGGKPYQEAFFLKLMNEQPGIWTFVCAVLEMHEKGDWSYDFAEGVLKGITVAIQAIERQIEADELNQQWGL